MNSADEFDGSGNWSDPSQLLSDTGGADPPGFGFNGTTSEPLSHHPVYALRGTAARKSGRAAQHRSRSTPVRSRFRDARVSEEGGVGAVASDVATGASKVHVTTSDVGSTYATASSAHSEPDEPSADVAVDQSQEVPFSSHQSRSFSRIQVM